MRDREYHLRHCHINGRAPPRAFAECKLIFLERALIVEPALGAEEPGLRKDGRVAEE